MPPELLELPGRNGADTDVADEQPLALPPKNRWGITLAQIKETIAALALNDEQSSAVEWIHDYGWRNHKSLAQVATELRHSGNRPYDKNTLYKILTGRHEAKLDSFVGAVKDLRERVEIRRAVDFPFVKTTRCAEIWEFCEMANTYQDIVSIIGWSHSGKSEGVRSFAEQANRNRYGRVRVIEIPPEGHRAETQRIITQELGISSKLRTATMLEQIVRSVDSSMTLIFDEMHRCIPTSRRRPSGTVEMIRYIHDQTKCGVVLVMNEEGRMHLEQGAAHERKGEVLEYGATFSSLVNREISALRLERMHSAEDLALFAESIGLPPATGDAAKLQTTINSTQSLGKWIKLLRAAMRAAHRHSVPVTWDHVINADRFFTAKQKGGK